MGSNAGLHTTSMLGQTNLHMHMSMAIASWLGVVVYTTMLSLYPSKCDLEAA